MEGAHSSVGDCWKGLRIRSTPKNAKGVRGQSWKNSEMFLEQKTGRPLTGGSHRWASNHTSQNPDLRLSTNSKTGWTPHFQRPSLHLRRPRKTRLGTTTNAKFQLWNITLDIEYTWMRVISIPHVPCRNLPITILDPSQ